MKFDFAGYATKNDLVCSDGVTIKHNAFADCDGKRVPLIWNHQHGDVSAVLGHADLENRDDGVYAYCSFNDTAKGEDAKKSVMHGDVRCLSIFANGLTRRGSDVVHGDIKEVSLVLAGANPGAYIDSIIEHSDTDTFSAELCYDEPGFIVHADDKKDDSSDKSSKDEGSDDKKEKTVEEVFKTMNDEQKAAVYAIVTAISEAKEGDTKDEKSPDTKEETKMKHNAFDTTTETQRDDELMHTALSTIIADGKKYGSMKESFLAHADEYGIKNIDYLFPDAKNVTSEPLVISRDMTWVSKVMSSVGHSPFPRIKSIFADITADEARARGYTKGKLKKEEVFSLLKRTTSPTTIYKKQKIDRDDALDITDFDVISFLKTEMRTMLDEEIARAILVGDGRLASSDDKISEDNIRPVWKDADLYTIKKAVTFEANATDSQKAKAVIKTAIKSRKDYKGSGNPVLFTTEEWVTDMLLIEDSTGRVIYDTMEKLATALRVSAIITVPVMEGLQREATGGKKMDLIGIIVNLADYKVGADKGGSINMFDDFDIDYNQMKYLIETRCSGALYKPYSAIVLESEAAATADDNSGDANV